MRKNSDVAALQAFWKPASICLIIGPEVRWFWFLTHYEGVVSSDRRGARPSQPCSPRFTRIDVDVLVAVPPGRAALAEVLRPPNPSPKRANRRTRMTPPRSILAPIAGSMAFCAGCFRRPRRSSCSAPARKCPGDHVGGALVTILTTPDVTRPVQRVCGKSACGGRGICKISNEGHASVHPVSIHQQLDWSRAAANRPLPIMVRRRRASVGLASSSRPRMSGKRRIRVRRLNGTRRKSASRCGRDRCGLRAVISTTSAVQGFCHTRMFWCGVGSSLVRPTASSGARRRRHFLPGPALPGYLSFSSGALPT